MKKIASALILLSLFAVANAQFTTSGNCLMLDTANIDKVFLFQKIESATEITYTGSEADAEISWEKFDKSVYMSGTKTISPEDNTGYKLCINGEAKYSFWVIDYSKYKPQLDTLTVVEADDKCENVKLVIKWTVPTIIYRDSNTVEHEIKRIFSIGYADKEWNGNEWGAKERKFTKAYPFTEIPLTAPFADTHFSLWGDQFAEQFGTADTLKTADYKAIAVKAYPKGEVAERDSKNEVERKGSDGISGSGPLVVDFTSNANEPVVNFYEWFIFNTETPNNYIRYTDRNLRYTFNESGNYRVRLKISSNGCTSSDSLDVKVLESKLEVPNVFTPNGDGVNDEFRVAYKSLTRFNCWVYNRWGRLVFQSDDAGKGWDGTINGKKATPGAYYYIIEATGTDKDSNGNPIVYKLSGDINLLRGK